MKTNDAAIPELEPHCGSWVVVNESGNPVFETFSRISALAAANNGFAVYTAAQWLAKFNAAIRAKSTT